MRSEVRAALEWLATARGLRRRVRNVIVLVAVAAGAAWLGRCSAPEPENITGPAIVSPENVDRGRPDPEVGMVESLVRPPLAPERELVAPGAGADRLEAMCRDWCDARGCQ